MNLPEIDATIAAIELDVDRHDQRFYALKTIAPKALCGTTMCMAGFTVVRHGYELIFNPDSVDGGSAGGRTIVVAEYCTVPGSGQHERIFAVAQRLLGLTDEEAVWFFSSCRTLAQIRALRDEVAAEERAAR